jgi:hypothetical protein
MTGVAAKGESRAERAKKVSIVRQTLSESYVFSENFFSKTLAGLKICPTFATEIMTQTAVIDIMRK